jgi:hypothetical protein
MSSSNGWESPNLPVDLNPTNRPVRTRMPGGVAGDVETKLHAPMPIPETLAIEPRSRGVLDRPVKRVRRRLLKTPYSYRACRDRRRPDGIASTMRQSPIITIPMNSKAKASTAILSPINR